MIARTAPAWPAAFILRCGWVRPASLIIVGGIIYLAIEFSLAPSTGTRVGYAQSGLVAAYGFDEGSGLSVSDTSGNGNQGTISGATWTSTAKFGKALSFDGVNDLVTINDSNSLDLTDNLTLEAWVRPTSTSNWRTVVLKEAPGELAYALYANDNAARPSVWLRSGGTNGSSQSLAGPARLTGNAWSHLAATYDRATLRLYVNGSVVSSRSLTISAQTSSNPLRIGGNLVWGEYFRGQIDEVRVYNRALSTTAIQADMNTPLGGAPDVTPPSVSVTSPADGATVANTVTVAASASDNLFLSGVQFFVDSVALGAEDTASPYSVAWNTNTTTNGIHAVTARARDAAGNTTLSTAIAVSVNNPPKLLISQPAPGATITGNAVDVVYTTSGDLTGVDHVHFILDAGGEVPDLTFDGAFQYSGVPPGSHTLNGFLVRADHTKIAGTDAVPVTFTTVTPDTTAPSVLLTAPAANSTVMGTVTVRADASDDVGVAGVQFLLDNAALGAEDLAPPYEIVWNTTLAANGNHGLSARARDGSGNTALSGVVVVSVANSGGSASTGEWSVPFSMPVVAVHQVLLPTGKVMMWDAGDFNSAGPVVWDPQTGTITGAPQNYTDLFCAGHVLLADGRLLTLGGDTRTTGLGVQDVNQFNAFTSTWSPLPPMSYRRWYPTGVTLSDGRVLVMSGYGDCYAPNCLIATPEVFDPVSASWTALPSANYLVPSYPFLFALPDGRVLNAGSYEGTIDTRVLDLNTRTWSIVDPTPIDAGSAVMYEPGRIMKAGKWANSDPPYVAAHANTYVLDMAEPGPAWRQTGPMNFPRAYNVLTLLPDGTTLATGGSLSTDPASMSLGVLEAEIWSPDTETWSIMARMQNPRLYHGSAMLLPDGRVLVAGSGRYGSLEQFTGEIFSPPYLFKGPRPVIASAPSVVQPAGTFFVATGDTDISAVTMVRTGAMTHSFNSDQRFLKLPFTQAQGGLTIDAPANLNVAPPGYYLLFVVNGAGVPSVGAFVRVPAPTEDLEPPTAPTGLAANGGLATASLSWAASTDNMVVAGYYVHRSTSPGFAPDLANRVGQTLTTSFTDSGLAAGIYYFRVTAYDQNGNLSVPSNEASAVSTSDSETPTVSMLSPADGTTVSGTINVSALASDNVGVAGVQFFLDGASIGAEDTTAPYSIAWNTVGTANGNHQLRATVRDASGNTATASPITVMVTNVAPTGLVMALAFNEGSGTVATDSSGQGNPGTLANASWTSGKFGSGVQFNGTSSWVTVADANSLDLTGSLTISAWVNPSSLTGNWRTIVLKERPPGLAYALYATDGASRPPAGYVYVGSGDVSVVSPSLLPLNIWTHVAVTFTGSQMQLYINGASVATRTVSGNILVSSGPLRIGGNGVWGEYFAGVIDEVRLYNRALTQTEIQNDMNTPVQ